MRLTIDDKFEASKPFLPSALVSNLSLVFREAGFELDVNEVLKEVHTNSYRLMEEMRAEVNGDCDPFYDDFPFLMYGSGISIYESDQLLLLKRKKAEESSDKSVIYLPNDEFSERFINGDETEIQKGKEFTRQCRLARVSVDGGYAKDSNSVWLDSKLVQDAVIRVFKNAYYLDLNAIESNRLCGMLIAFDRRGLHPFFEGLSHEFGHFLFKTEYENISQRDFVNHSYTKAHQLGSKYADMKSANSEYIREFFSSIVNAKAPSKK